MLMNKPEQNPNLVFKDNYFGFQEGAKLLKDAMKGIPDRVPVYAQMHEFTMNELGIPAKTFYTTPEQPLLRSQNNTVLMSDLSITMFTTSKPRL
jgi:hypothetical protein